MAKEKDKNKTKKAASEQELDLSFTINPVTIVQRTLQGRLFLTLDFFKRNWFYILAATLMMLMYISNKYECQSSLAEVGRLKVELNNAKTDCVDASSKYNSKILESNMQVLVDTMRLDITAPDQPPYQLTSN